MARSFKQARKSKGDGAGEKTNITTTTPNPNASASAPSTSVAAVSSSSAAQPPASSKFTPPLMATTSTSSSRRPVVPNIAAAGRLLVPAKPNWATTKPTASDIAIKQENGTLPVKTDGPHQNGVNHHPQRGGRGGRQRGGQKRGTGRPEIIRSEGVFSHGIGDEQRTRGSRNRAIKGEETVIGKLDVSLHDEALAEQLKKDGKRTKKRKLEDGDEAGGEAPATTFEQLWQSDEELDEEELSELIQGNFISDLKKADQLPFVLPANEEAQFNSLVQNRAKTEKQRDKAAVGDVKDIKLIKAGLLEPIDDSSEETGVEKRDKFLAAAETMRRLAEETGDSPELMLFQLPTSLVRIAQAQQEAKKAWEEANFSTPADPKKPAAIQQRVDGQNCLDAFPSGAQIGRIQFLRSGRVVLNIGGNRMDISEAIPSKCFEMLMRIEAHTGQPQQPAAGFPSSLAGALLNRTPSSMLFNDDLNKSQPPNVAHLLGSVSHQFVCSFDPTRMLGGEEKGGKKTTVLSDKPSTSKG